MSAEDQTKSDFPKGKTSLYIPKAPPISAPLVGILTFTMPQSEPLGLWARRGAVRTPEVKTEQSPGSQVLTWTQPPTHHIKHLQTFKTD